MMESFRKIIRNIVENLEPQMSIDDLLELTKTKVWEEIEVCKANGDGIQAGKWNSLLRAIDLGIRDEHHLATEIEKANPQINSMEAVETFLGI